jgi:hypothetical protein
MISNKVDIPYLNLSNLLPTPFVLFLAKYVAATIAVLVFAWLVVWLSAKFLDKGDTVQVSKIKPAEGVFLPVYIGLFVIALSFNQGISLESMFLIVFLFALWLHFENVSYFNPFLLFFGYRFYEVESESNISIIVITKRKDIKIIETFENLIRVNNFTFLETENE